jgi:hypothetical protein
MPEHDVRWRLPTKKGWPVGTRDLHFRVRSDEELLGVLLVSQGTIAWRPRHGRRGQELQMSWEDFDAIMQEAGRGRWRQAPDLEEED